MARLVALMLAAALAVALIADSVPGAEEVTRSSQGWGTIERDGIQWLVQPEGGLFYSKGVNFVDSGKESVNSIRKQAYFWRNFFPTMDEWRRAVGAQLAGWGFNTRGGWSDPSPQIGLALTVELDLGRQSKLHWFDPFDPAMEEKTAQWAEKLTAPYRNYAHLIGYFTDNEVGWWNSPLFLWYLKDGWENHTKRALWQLLYDHYGGIWRRLLKDWVPEGPLRGFEDLKSAGATLKLRPGGQGIYLVNRFMYLCARRYYQLMYQALRKVHPEALILGDRLPLYYHQDAVRAIDDYVDVISTNYNVDVPDGWVAPYYFDGLRRLTGKPVLVTEFFFAAKENRSGNRNETQRKSHAKPGHLMTVATQEERARGVSSALRNFARFPNVVGTHWFQYCDEPFGGREDGEDYNMGLIDHANRPYEEVTRVFAQMNPELERIHSESLTSWHARNGGASATGDPGASPDTCVPISRASRHIDLSDQSLADWQKEETRLEGFHAPQPYVPFGDVHMAWAPEGIYLATLANTYVDPNFLAYQGEFPISEAFQLHAVVKVDGKPNHFAICLVPHPNPLFPDGFEIRPRLYRYVGGRPAASLPTPGRLQQLNKSLPHIALEALLPAEWLGLKRLEPGMRLRMNIALANYYRELTMAWSGVPALRDIDDLRSLKTVVLRDE